MKLGRSGLQRRNLAKKKVVVNALKADIHHPLRCGVHGMTGSLIKGRFYHCCTSIVNMGTSMK